MVPIIPEITHGFKIQGEKCLVKHIEDLAKRFLKTILRPEGENTQKGANPSALLLSGLFLFLIKGDSCVAIKALNYLPPQGTHLTCYVLVNKSRYQSYPHCLPATLVLVKRKIISIIGLL